MAGASRLTSGLRRYVRASNSTRRRNRPMVRGDDYDGRPATIIVVAHDGASQQKREPRAERLTQKPYVA
jgi:hypothetical protein